MHQRFAAGEDNPLHLQRAQTEEVGLEILPGDLANLANSPDIAHHAAAIAPVVREEHKNRKSLYAVFRCGDHAETLIPARCISSR